MILVVISDRHRAHGEPQVASLVLLEDRLEPLPERGVILEESK